MSCWLGMGGGYLALPAIPSHAVGGYSCHLPSLSIPSEEACTPHTSANLVMLPPPASSPPWPSPATMLRAIARACGSSCGERGRGPGGKWGRVNEGDAQLEGGRQVHSWR